MKRKYDVIVACWMLTVVILLWATTIHAGSQDLRGTWDVQKGLMVQIKDYTQNGQIPVISDDASGSIVITTQTENVFGGYLENPGGDGDTIYITGVIVGNRVIMQERHHATWHLLEGILVTQGSETKMIGIFYGNEDNGSPPSSAESGTFMAKKR